jgi:hypothetical protein
MPPGTARPHRPGFLFYYAYEDEVPVPGRGRALGMVARRTATVVAVLAVATLLGLTLGPAFQS